MDSDYIRRCVQLASYVHLLLNHSIAGDLSKRNLTHSRTTPPHYQIHGRDVLRDFHVLQKNVGKDEQYLSRKQAMQGWFLTDDNRDVMSRSGCFVGCSRRRILSSRAERRSGLLHAYPFLSGLTSF